MVSPEGGQLIGSVLPGPFLRGHTSLPLPGQWSSGYIDPWSYHFVMCTFSVPFSSAQLKSLTTMWRLDEGAKEEIEGVGSVIWHSGKAPG